MIDFASFYEAITRANCYSEVSTGLEQGKEATLWQENLDTSKNTNNIQAIS